MGKQKITNTDIFENLPVPEAVRMMAVPAIISQLIVLIYNMADTFFLGRTNNPYMVAGASLILPVFNISLSLASLTGVGGGALISRLLGEKREDEVQRVYTFVLSVSLTVALIFAVGMAVFMRPLMGLLGAGPETYDYARGYALCVIVFSQVTADILTVTLSLVVYRRFEKKYLQTK